MTFGSALGPQETASFTITNLAPRWARAKPLEQARFKSENRARNKAFSSYLWRVDGSRMGDLGAIFEA